MADDAGRATAVTVVAGAGTFGGVELEVGRTALIPAGRRADVAAAGPQLRYLVAAPDYLCDYDPDDPCA